MKKLTSIFLLVFSLILIKPNSADACSCIMPAPPQESMAQSATVFSGKVTKISPSTSSDIFGTGFDVAFDVTEIWKGEMNDKVTINTAQDSAACGYAFEEGKEYLVYTYETEGELSTGLCSRTTLLSNAQEDLTALGEGTIPNPSQGAENNSNLTLILSIGGAIILVGGIYILMRKK